MKMNIVQMYELCKDIYSKNIQSKENDWEGYEYIGLRFEDKERQIGETCEYSRNNIDREDERDFPEYGTDEYFEMELLDGTSAWDMGNDNTYKIHSWDDKTIDCTRHFLQNYCYVIAGNNLGRTSHTVIDDGEIVIKDAIVIAQIF
jgi:hypothetical protein